MLINLFVAVVTKTMSIRTLSIFVAYCLLGVRYCAVVLSERVSVIIESEPSTNSANFI